MSTLVERLDARRQFPGFRFFSEDEDARMFSEQGANHVSIIQVFAPAVLKGMHRNQHWNQEVICTLRGEDCELYFLLRWKDKFRNHSDVAMGRFFTHIAAVLVLTIFHVFAFGVLVNVLSFFASHSWMSLVIPVFFCAVIASFLEVSLWDTLRAQFKRLRAERKIDTWVAARGQTYSRPLLQSLSHANNQDVVLEATRALARL